MKKREDDMSPETGEDFEAFEEWEGEGEPEGEGGGDRDVMGEEGEGFAEMEEESGESEGGFTQEEEPQEAAPEEEAPAAPEEAEEEVPDLMAEEQPEGMPEETPKPEPASAPIPPESKRAQKFDRAALDLTPDVPVQVVAVIGKRGISMKELMELRMGQVIDLKRPPSETVDIVVHGKLFARGELVEIDGKLGVKILKLVR